MKTLHFCGGLPRTGSTVLMNILQENPAIFTTGTDPLPNILNYHVLSAARVHEPFFAMDKKQADNAMYGFVQQGTKGYYEALTDKPIVISKSRGWSDVLHLYPNSKYICMIRDLRDIVQSFINLNNNLKSLHSLTSTYKLLPALADHEKFSYFFDEESSLCSALHQEIPRMMELYENDSKKVIFIRYEDFTKNPKHTLNKLYDFLNIDYFEHDLNNIPNNVWIEHDHSYYREVTSHIVKNQFRYYKEPKLTISKSLQDKIVKEHIFYYQNFYPELL